MKQNNHSHCYLHTAYQIKGRLYQEALDTRFLLLTIMSITLLICTNFFLVYPQSMMNRKNVLLPSCFGVGIETGINIWQNTSTNLWHVLSDLIAHCVMNTVPIEKLIAKNVTPQHRAILTPILDALFHLIGKYGSHYLIHTIEHRGHNHNNIQYFGPRIQQLMQQHHQGPEVISLSIIVCLLTEQIVKYLIAKKVNLIIDNKSPLKKHI